MAVVNAGDSRAALIRAGAIEFITKEHKPDDADEAARIENSPGGFVLNGRVNGDLNVSRGFGDGRFKQVYKPG